MGPHLKAKTVKGLMKQISQRGLEKEQSLFQTANVWLKLEIGDTTVWSNPKSLSPHFCMPPHLQYQKETKELRRAEEVDVREQIENP